MASAAGGLPPVVGTATAAPSASSRPGQRAQSRARVADVLEAVGPAAAGSAAMPSTVTACTDDVAVLASQAAQVA